MIPTIGIPSWSIAYFGKKKLRLLNIKRIPLSRTGGKDRKFWHYSKSGRFAFSSSVVIFIVALVGVKTKSGKTLGGLNIPGKVKHFCWRLCYNSLPHPKISNGETWKWTTPVPNVPQTPENLLHILFQCSSSIHIWLLSFHPNSVFIRYQTPSASLWVKELI